jgi:hypothetical protein
MIKIKKKNVSDNEIIMERNVVIIEDSGVQHELAPSCRDWNLLNGPFFEQGPLFLNTLGVYKNFTVAKGIPKGSTVEVNRIHLCMVTEQLLAAVQRDMDLLQYNYSFCFTSNVHKGSGAISGFMVDGYCAYLKVRPKGFCLLELIESSPNSHSRVIGKLDIRNKREMETDNWGMLKTKRKKDTVTWPDVLPPMIEFLKKSKSKTVIIHHR